MPPRPLSLPTTPRRALIEPTDRGLFCEAGGFYIDPWRPVEFAVTTHAHADHASWGCARYLASPTGAVVLQARLGADASITPSPFGETTEIGGVRVSLHPAAHVLGSAQVRVEHGGEVWVVSGDYKTDGWSGLPSERFEAIRCHTFITESTFGLPLYHWPDERSVYNDINAWWRANRERGRTSVVYAYALGKAQRVLAGLDETIGPIGVHGAVETINAAYEACGVRLPRAVRAVKEAVKDLKGVGLIVAPPSAAGSAWVRKFGETSTAFASGWMMIRGTRRRRAMDRGFVLSDHADWDGLLSTIRETGAERVGVTHGYTDVMVRWLREQGKDAWEVPTRFRGEVEEAEEGDAAGTSDGPATDAVGAVDPDPSPGREA